ncbi:hypothetical protein L248_0463 [Schleiferilactobacillus shenzhenensis LY-73]|uniref:Uncharacterized protein n=1 Tax=Schleiferilactobacillus shenzhenensis LY-73 TaxID=1231336 RepID=U4TL05_9LACO|nr:hypothetical protein L248_0463 [Schleiferilactobacillus shenzhenensis LY-73]
MLKASKSFLNVLLNMSISPLSALVTQPNYFVPTTNNQLYNIAVAKTS